MTLFVVSGSLKLTVGDKLEKLEEVILNENEYYVLAAKKIHRMYGITDCVT